MKKNKRKSIYVYATIFTLFMLYIVLIFFELAFEYHVILNRADVKKITDNKEQTSSKNVNIKTKNPIDPMSYQNVYELVELVKKYNIAPLAHRPNTLYSSACDEGYGEPHYISDRYGFRNNDSSWENSHNDLILIGDSFTFGRCVETNESFSGIIADKYNSLTLASSGNSPIIYASIIKEFKSRLNKPKYIAIFFYPNDNIDESDSIYHDIYFKKNIKYFIDGSGDLNPKLFELYDEADNVVSNLKIKRDLLLNNQNVSKSSNGSHAVSRSITIWDRIIYRLKLTVLIGTANVYYERMKDWFVFYVNDLLTTFIDLNRIFVNEDLSFSTKLAIDVLYDACNESGCTPILFYIPNNYSLDAISGPKSYRKALINYANSKKMSFLDASDVLSTLGRAAYSPYGPHLSKEGNRLLAHFIEEQLLTHQITPLPPVNLRE